MKKKYSNDLLLGAHTSAAGGCFNALLEGQQIGATTVQLFTANQKQWHAKPLSEEAIDHFHHTLRETHLSHIMSHASYLINLGCPNPLNLNKSREAFYDEIERCQALGITYLNFHPGAALTDTLEVCLDRIVESLLMMENLFVDDSLRLLLETTAGQGSCVGYQFEHLAYIIEKTRHRIPIGVCIDTCHIFAAGYEVRTAAGWKETLSLFDQSCGLEHLYAFHLNDSVYEKGARKDRHAPLGEGTIGLECFKYLVTHPKTATLAMYLETPGGLSLWDKEIGILRAFAEEKYENTSARH